MDSLPDQQSIRIEAAQESIARLNLLKPDAAPAIVSLLENSERVHPRAACAAYRKGGEQITDAEKSVLKIRKNTFMSKKALSEISDKGAEDPTRAHETTLLRASFVMFRYRNALSISKMMEDHPQYPVQIQYDIFHPDACETCKALNEKSVPANWGLFAPCKCVCVTAPYGLRSVVDWFAGVT